jgi:hypothetical protein
MGKKKIVEDFGDDGVSLKKHKLKKDSFLKKLKTKIDELFESDNLSFNGKVLMLTVYGMVSSIGLIIASSIGNVILKAIWAAINFTAKCPTFGAICGIGWFMFILSFLAFGALVTVNCIILSNISSFDEDDLEALEYSIFENHKKEDSEVF